MTASVEVDQALLALKIGFLVLLYLFIWLIVRSATRDLRLAPQESLVIGAADVAALRAEAPIAHARLLVLDSPTLRRGASIELAGPTSIGRGPENAVRLDGDEFVSSRHARLDVRPDGTWVEDAGSTNGTFVNGARVTEARLLQPGDVVRVGQTDFRVET